MSLRDLDREGSPVVGGEWDLATLQASHFAKKPLFAKLIVAVKHYASAY